MGDVKTCALAAGDLGVKFTSRSHDASTASFIAAAQVVPPLLANSAAFAPLSATAVSVSSLFPVFVSVVFITVAVTPVGVAGKLSALASNLAAPTSMPTATPGPDSATVFGAPLTLEVIVTVPGRAPSIAGVKVISIAQISPASRLPTQPVDANSAAGADVTVMIETGIALLLLLVTVICRVALAIPTVCVLKTTDAALRMMLGVVTAAAVPETVMLGFVAALDWIVKVAVREPAFSGLSNVAPIVQVAPAFTVTEAPAGTQVPVATNSVAFAPLFSMPVIVSFSVPAVCQRDGRRR